MRYNISAFVSILARERIKSVTRVGSMGRLTFKLLGVPEIYHAGQLVRFPTRKAQALLIYLAVSGGLHSREQLSALFWPDSAPRLGRAAFRNTLLRLRAALSEGAPTEAQHLFSEGNSLGFDAASDFELDLMAVETAVQALRAGETPPLAFLRVVYGRTGDNCQERGLMA